MQSDELLLQKANQIKISVITKLILSYIAHKIKFTYPILILTKTLYRYHTDIKSVTKTIST